MILFDENSDDDSYTKGFVDRQAYRSSDSSTAPSHDDSWMISSPSHGETDDENDASDEEDRDYNAKEEVGDHPSADAMLAYELNQLSLKERDSINEEIHGIRQPYPIETPQLLQNAIEQLRVELNFLSRKHAYDIAQTLAKTYINADDFRLIFLRCELFDARKAALRMVAFLDLMLELFGEKALERELCFDDLDENSLKFLEMGNIQILPGRDRLGRRIGGNFACKIDATIKSDSRLKSSMYVLWKLVRSDIEVQRKGLVGIFWLHNLSFNDIRTRSYAHKKAIPALPLRFGAIHNCLPGIEHNLKNMAKVMQIVTIGPENRKRLRVHTGSATECLYTLQTFGIQSNQVPISANSGKLKVGYFHKWIDIQRKRDEAAKTDTPFLGIDCPQQRDVLFGRGWPKMHHPGNAFFRNMIESNIDSYNNAASKRDKTVLSWSIVSELIGHGVRFLREEEKCGCWVEVSNEVARQKVSVAFRDIRKAAKRKCRDDPGRGRNGSGAARPDNNNSGGSGTVDAASRAFLDMDGGKRQRCQPCDSDAVWT